MALAESQQDFEAKVAEQALPVGTRLAGGQFTITALLGAGGFGITYRAKDNMLGRTIVLKECFPENLCYRDGVHVAVRNKSDMETVIDIVKMFMREARSLAKLRHQNIVGVHRAFEENNTAYMALDLIDGQDLFDMIDKKMPRLSPGRIQSVLLQMLDAIEKVHEVDLLHRDISPDNIIIEKNGTPVLIDFGAARGDASRQTRAVSTLMVVKEGYSPHEFYVAGSKQEPNSDLYALGATFYHVISGVAPPDSQSRLIEVAGNRPDPCKPLAGRFPGYSENFLAAIDEAMQVHPSDRLQTAAKWRSLIKDLDSEDGKVAKGSVRPTSKDISLELEVSLTKLVKETNNEVRKTRRLDSVIVRPMPEPEREKSEKPTWVEEFNQETLAPPVEELSDPDEAYAPLEVAEEMFAEETNEMASPADFSAEADKSETNWVDLAKEKQQRHLEAEAREYGLFDDTVPDKVRTAPDSRPTSIVGDPLGIEVTGEPVKRKKFGTLGLVLTLLLIGGMLMLSQAV